MTRAIGDLERRAGPLAHPAFAVLLYVSVIYAWHIPAAYDLAVTHPLVHVLEHTTFVLAGAPLLVAPALADPRPHAPGRARPDRLHGGHEAVRGALGMGLAFAPSALYPYYVHHARVWGISAIEDQGIAGLIMAIEQSLVMGIALVVLFMRALTESERAQQRRERLELA